GPYSKDPTQRDGTNIVTEVQQWYALRMADEQQLIPTVTVVPPGAGTRRVSLGGGRWVPRRFLLVYDDPDRASVVWVEVLVTADGTPIPYQYTFTARLAPHVSDLDADGNLVNVEDLTANDWQRMTGDARFPLDTIIERGLQQNVVYGEA